MLLAGEGPVAVQYQELPCLQIDRSYPTSRNTLGQQNGRSQIRQLSVTSSEEFAASGCGWLLDVAS